MKEPSQEGLELRSWEVDALTIGIMCLRKTQQLVRSESQKLKI